MDEDKFEKWFDDKYDDLAAKFADRNEDQFMEFAMDEFNSEQADYSDYLYNMYKDRQFEREQEKIIEESK